MRIKRENNEEKPAIIQVGKIRVGEMTETKGKKHPKSLDYFRATGDFSWMFHEVFGEKPTVIPILFFSEEENISCNEVIEYRTKDGSLFAQGDGENFLVWSKEKKYIPIDAKKRPNLIKDLAASIPEGSIRHVLRMNFIVPGVGVVGAWTFETSGVESSLPAIRNSYDFVKKQAGRVIGVTFNLTVKKVKSNKPGVISQYPVVSLIPVLNKEQGAAIENKIKLLEG